MREQHQDERGERDEVDQDVCERRDEENERGRDGGDENESVRAAAIRAQKSSVSASAACVGANHVEVAGKRMRLRRLATATRSRSGAAYLLSEPRLHLSS